VLVILTLLISQVWAAPQTPEGWNRTRLMIRTVGETWDDAGITSNYGMGTVGFGLGVMQPIWGPLAVDIELSYKRLREGGKNISAEEYSGRYLQLIPISVLLEYRVSAGKGRLEAFFGVGPSLVAYSENHQRSKYMTDVAAANEKPGLRMPNDPEPDPTVMGDVVSGMRPSVETRLGLRIDSGLIQAPAAPARAGPVTGLEFEIYAARRFTSTKTGFNLNTWRACIGMGLRF